MTFYGFESPSSIREEQPSLDNMIKRQRSMMLLCFAVLILGSFFASLGGCDDALHDQGAGAAVADAQEDKADNADNKEDAAQQDASPDQDADASEAEGESSEHPEATDADPFDLDYTANTEAEAAALKRDELERLPQPQLRHQNAAVVTEGVSVLAYPWHEKRVELAREGKWLDETKSWLPPLVSFVGMDLCDRNRALEACSRLPGEQMMPRCRGGIDANALEMMGYGSYCEHLVMVEFLEQGKGWKVHGYSFGMDIEKALPQAIERDWPESDVIAQLTADVTQMTETLTSYRLQSADVFTRSDEAAKAFAEMEWAMDQQQQPQASAWLRKSMAADPAFTFPMYRRLNPWVNPNLPSYTLALRLLRDYEKSGGTSTRMRSYLISALNAKPTDDRRARAMEIAAKMLEEEKLNMAAYTGIVRFKMLDGDASFAALRQAVYDYPHDGRYHMWLAKELAVNPETAAKALEYGQSSIELRPWSYGDLTQFGITQLNFAQPHYLDREYPRETVFEEFERASATLQSGWSRNPNRVEFVVDYMVLAWTRGGHTVEHLDETTKQWVYAFCFISQSLTNSAHSNEALKLFPDAQWRSRVERGFVEMGTNADFADPGSEIPLLMSICVRLRDTLASPDLATQKQLVPTVHATIKRYREFGGRNPKVENLWDEIYGDPVKAVAMLTELDRLKREALKKAEEDAAGSGED